MFDVGSKYITMNAVVVVFFIFQTEDGIRDGHVTGVQTCTLPISVEQIDTNRQPYEKYFPDAGARVYEENLKNCGAPTTLMASRSEERRVGKEWRSRWRPYN